MLEDFSICCNNVPFCVGSQFLSDDAIAKVKENCLNIWKIRKYVVILHPHFVALCPKHKFN